MGKEHASAGKGQRWKGDGTRKSLIDIKNTGIGKSSGFGGAAENDESLERTAVALSAILHTYFPLLPADSDSRPYDYRYPCLSEARAKRPQIGLWTYMGQSRELATGGERVIVNMIEGVQQDLEVVF